VSRLDPYAQALRSLEHRPYIEHSVIPDVAVMAEAADGRLWLGSRSENIAVGDVRTERFEALSWRPATPGRLTGIQPLGAQVYIASSRGLHVLDAASGRQTSLPGSLASHGLDALPIDQITAGADSTLWIASGTRLYRAAPPGAPRNEPAVRVLDLTVCSR
jgi:ligand-binding sensor domain-containing protein